MLIVFYNQFDFKTLKQIFTLINIITHRSKDSPIILPVIEAFIPTRNIILPLIRTMI